jgi:hypothetical protein
MMWRLTVLTVRNGGLSDSQFRQQIIEGLAPAIADAGRGDARLRRFVVTLPPAQVDVEIAKVFLARFDALLEFWFDTSDDAVQVMNAVSRAPRVLASAAQTLDGANGVAWLAEVFPKKPESGKTRIKFLAGGNVAEGWKVADAQKYWSEMHPVIAQTAPKVWGPLTRYVQFHGRDVSGLDIGESLAVARFVPLCADMGFAQQQDFLTTYTNDDMSASSAPMKKNSRGPERCSPSWARSKSLFRASDLPRANFVLR